MTRNRFVPVGALTGFAAVLCCAVAAGSAFALPPGRSYEMVSPLFKGGQGATAIKAVAAGGEAVAYYSPGVFAGAPSTPTFGVPPYLARRGKSGWSTIPLIAPLVLVHGRAGDLSPGLDLDFVSGPPGPNAQNEFLRTETLSLHSTGLPDTLEQWGFLGELTSPGEEVSIEYRAASPDFCHVLFYTLNTALLAEAEGTGGNEFYEFDRGCNGEPASLTLLGVNNQDKIINRECRVNVGIQYGDGTGSRFGAVSADGSEVFFSDCPNGVTSPGNPEPGTPYQLFVRVGGSRTLEVSRPLEAGREFGGCVGEGAPKTPGEVPCEGALARPSADFAGASRDGSTVYFTTAAPLTETDKDTGRDLYMATIGCPQAKPGCQVAEREVTSLTQVSRDPNGGAAEVQGVLRVAPDGQRAYFVAGGDLLDTAGQQALEGEGRPGPVVGAVNLYMYDSAEGTVEFVGDLCTGRQQSGTAEDIHCPSAETDVSLWTSGAQPGGESQTAGLDGKFLVFSTYAQLTSDDTNAAKDVYRYDAETGELERVSIGEDGYDANGNAERAPPGQLPGARIAEGHHGGESVREQYEMDNRAISEDGSRIVFTSAEPLSPESTNGLVNAYEWHAGLNEGEGSVTLVSTGSDEEPVHEAVISPEGSSVFFVTVQGLVPQDTDGLPDLYDARLGVGFPAQPAERRPCEGDGCQGPLTNPAPLLVPGSVAQAPGGNFQAPAATVKAKSKPTPSCRRGYKRDKRGKCVKVRKRKAGKAANVRDRGQGSSRGGRS